MNKVVRRQRYVSEVKKGESLFLDLPIVLEMNENVTVMERIRKYVETAGGGVPHKVENNNSPCLALALA